METDPIVSIIIPAYNGQDTIARAIESALNQTLKEIEVIVVDDGSTDGTPQVLKRYEGRIIHVTQENKGVAGGRNMGIAHSHGKYLCFLDQDDTLMPRKAELQASLLDAHPEAGLCYGVCQEIDPRDGQVVRVRGVNPDLLDRTCGPFPHWCQIGAAMIRREWLESLGGFDERFRYSDDTDLWYRLWAAGCRFLPTEEVVSTYTLTTGGGNVSKAAAWSEHLEALERHISAMGTGIDEESKRRRRTNVLLRIGINQLRAGNRSDALSAWEKATFHCPALFGRAGTWSTVLQCLDPNHRVPGSHWLPDLKAFYRDALDIVSNLRTDEGAAAIRARTRQAAPAVSLAIARLAFSRGKGFTARFWLVRALLARPGWLVVNGNYRLFLLLSLGPTLGEWLRKVRRLVFGLWARDIRNSLWGRNAQ